MSRLELDLLAQLLAKAVTKSNDDLAISIIQSAIIAIDTSVLCNDYVQPIELAH